MKLSIGDVLLFAVTIFNFLAVMSLFSKFSITSLKISELQDRYVRLLANFGCLEEAYKGTFSDIKDDISNIQEEQAEYESRCHKLEMEAFLLKAKLENIGLAAKKCLETDSDQNRKELLAAVAILGKDVKPEKKTELSAVVDVLKDFVSSVLSK